VFHKENSLIEKKQKKVLEECKIIYD